MAMNTQPNVAADAKAKARQSRYDQIVWTERDGSRRADRVTADSVKAAMLAAGTKGRFTLYQAHTAHAFSITWRLAVAYLGNLRRGYYAHG